MLNSKNFAKITMSALSTVDQRGADYYSWKNAPEVGSDEKITLTSGWGEDEKTEEIPPSQAMSQMTQKLDGAYGERFIMSLGTVAALIKNGYNVRFVQFQKESGVPFDASGWTVMVVETMPVFHISPDDLNLQDVADLVEILPDDKADDVSWKETNKVGEFQAMMMGAIQPGLDLVEIAKKHSK